MRRIVVYGKPVFDFTISAQEIEMLVDLSTRHYDATCKMASALGGFIYGWRNMAAGHVAVAVSATWRDLDLCCKILEGRQFYRQNEQHLLRMASDMAMEFGRALRYANEITENRDWYKEVP